MPYFLWWIPSFLVTQEMSPVGVSFRGKGVFVSLQGDRCCACNAQAYIQKIPYFHAFFDKNHHLSFSAQRKNIFSGKNKYHLSRYYKKDLGQARISWKDHLSRTHEENIFIFPNIFLRKIIFPFVSKNKIIFSGKRNIIFSDNTRKIILQCDFFGKTIFSKHLEKENIVFRAVINVNKT